MAKSADAFRTISEVSDWLDTPAHVLRFWESRFTQVKPIKRAGGRRYYRPNDMLLLGGLKKLLHEDGLSIKEAQQVLRDQGVKEVSGLSRPIEGEAAEKSDAASVKSAMDRVTARGTAPAPKPDILADVPAAANSPKLVQQDLFAAPEPKPEPEAPAATEAPAPDAVSPTAPEPTPVVAEDLGRIPRLRAALQARTKADAEALRPLYERLRKLRAQMDAPLARNNEK
ncbi:MerR family transcriptional regulator [Pseudoruegeria sp. SHC-113]|uniref:MerR family transcriptional regulator n=1 Tax=Pseudoruegeria sp. SHC-113 TaxID=2855439 RepID=UPI0021BB0429|nr:MerR family transcriptional regulator [Pseudoruegeria sp. SHC-113]MCT8160728.1 MerR family transcriptional regulator [Pseudoruegeria sp. SHC-113]